MAEQKENPAAEPEHKPNFELPRHGVIREDNWPEYQAKGFIPLWNGDGSTLSVRFAQGQYGTAHVYTGDAYDEDEQRPLQHKPGVGLYSDPDGIVYNAEHERKRKEFWRDLEARQRESGGGAGAN
jgi:hypothetical protein